MNSPYAQIASARLRQATEWLLDILLPPTCLNCGAMVTTSGTLCASCWGRVTFLGPPQCACCGQPFDIDLGPATLCGACLARRPSFERARAVFRYDDASRPLVLRFKHADQTAATPVFARWMARAGVALLADADIIVPVPLHRWRLFRRRYNQAALLANAVAELTGRPSVPDALDRIRRTPPQGTMGRRQRQHNVRGAFRLRRPLAVRRRRVLLVDDVLTTGATVDECVRVLLDGGATAVDVLTLARVVLAQG